jgi:uncharacterized membrane protein
MTTSQAIVVVVGLLLLPVGLVVRRWAAHAYANSQSSDFSWRLTLRINVVIGHTLTLLAAGLVLGGVIGAIVWGNAGRPRWPW